jgi:hypothetical protein
MAQIAISTPQSGPNASDKPSPRVEIAYSA